MSTEIFYKMFTVTYCLFYNEKIPATYILAERISQGSESSRIPVHQLWCPCQVHQYKRCIHNRVHWKKHCLEIFIYIYSRKMRGNRMTEKCYIICISHFIVDFKSIIDFVLSNPTTNELLHCYIPSNAVLLQGDKLINNLGVWIWKDHLSETHFCKPVFEAIFSYLIFILFISHYFSITWTFYSLRASIYEVVRHVDGDTVVAPS